MASWREHVAHDYGRHSIPAGTFAMVLKCLSPAALVQAVKDQATGPDSGGVRGLQRGGVQRLN
jgi:hypothetical protein